MDEKGQSRISRRYDYLDALRGLALISMILYHGVWDLVYIGNVDWKWFRSDAAFIWQQSICWTFVLLSGFCWMMGRHRLKRGLIVLGAGLLTSLVTWIFTYNERVTFGILTFLGTAMLVMIPLEKVLGKIPAKAGCVLGFALFLITRGINDEYLGFGPAEIIRLPHGWYQKGLFMTFFGFTDEAFYSADYFSVFPWIFLFVTGYFLYRIARDRNLLDKIADVVPRLPFSALGRHSLLIYLLHQPVMYLVLVLLGVIKTPG